MKVSKAGTVPSAIQAYPSMIHFPNNLEPEIFVSIIATYHVRFENILKHNTIIDLDSLSDLSARRSQAQDILWFDMAHDIEEKLIRDVEEI
jgi:hypothetical protein